MAEDKESGQEKELPASGRKRAKAREKGNVCKSQEVNTAGLILSLLILIALGGGVWFQNLATLFRKFLAFDMFWNRGELSDMALRQLIVDLGSLQAPIFLTFVVIGILANVAQVGFLLAWEKLMPDFTKLNPIQGMKQFVSFNALNELVKSILKGLVIVWIAYRTIKPAIGDMVYLGGIAQIEALKYGAALAYKLLWRVWIFMVFLAMADWAFQKWKHERDLKMTKEEQKEEMKSMEGDPKIKSRIRSIQFQMARKRMMAEVPEADVVITNPVHVAVALRYDRTSDMAPIVVAKGAGLLCQKIKEIAAEHKVPVVENPPLARFLYRNVELKQEIPVEVYQAVAEILATVYRLKGKVNHGAAA